MARVEYLLNDTADAAPKVVVLLGPPGNGARATLLRGIAPRLEVSPAQVRGRWDPSSPVQLCAAPDDVPAAPAPADSGIRVVLVAAPGLRALPRWATVSRAPDVFTIGPLSLGELDGFLEARLGEPVEAASAATLAHATGSVPGVLAREVEALRAAGRLERHEGIWVLQGSPHTDDVRDEVSARLGALPDEERTLVHTIALAEPWSLPADRSGVDRLIAGGLVEEVAGGRVAFRSPLVAEAVRRTAPTALAERIHGRSLDRGPVTPQAMLWAFEHGRPVRTRAVEDAIQRALDQRDGAGALRLAEAALTLGDAMHATGGFGTTQLAWLHLRAAHAARRLPDPDRAAEHLATATEIVGLLPADSPLQLDLASTTAEVRGFLDGDTDAALAALRACPAPDAPAAADLGALAYLQLVTAARLDEAAGLAARHGGDFWGARPELRTRARLAGHIALVAQGRPHAALRRTVPVLARQSLSPRPHPEVLGEAQIAYVVAALGSDGPAAYPALARQFDARHEHGYRPDVVGFACTRATWTLACGDVAGARRIALPALGANEHADASGIGPLLTALLLECSALLGDRATAEVLVERLAWMDARASRMTQGARDAHEVVAAFCLGDDGPGLARERAEAHLSRGHLGFAAEVLHAATRFGDPDAAVTLAGLGDRLDGNLHRIRVAHASALVAGDPVRLVEVAEQFRRAGLSLLAAEAAQQAVALGSAPESLGRRARSYPAALASPLPAHPLLATAGTDVAAAVPLPLTEREAEVLRLIEAGLSNADIASRLHLSPRTVEGHITRLYRKIGGTRRPPVRRLERA